MMLNLVVPIAGRGSRFHLFTDVPKPFIEVKGRPMILRALDNLPKADQTIIIYCDAHESYMQGVRGELKDRDVHYVSLPHVTSGQACTVMTAKDYVDMDGELLVADTDQLLDWVPEHFLDFNRRNDAVGAMTVFRGHQTNWSYAYFNSALRIEAVVEKIPITSDAIAGVRWFAWARLAFEDLEDLLSEPVVGEYNMGSVYNIMIQRGDIVLAYPVPRIYPMGTPEELERTLKDCTLLDDLC